MVVPIIVDFATSTVLRFIPPGAMLAHGTALQAYAISPLTDARKISTVIIPIPMVASHSSSAATPPTRPQLRAHVAPTAGRTFKLMVAPTAFVPFLSARRSGLSRRSIITTMPIATELLLMVARLTYSKIHFIADPTRATAVVVSFPLIIRIAARSLSIASGSM